MKIVYARKVIIFLLAILMASCIKDEIDLDNVSNQIYWNPKIGVPVAYGTLSLTDMIEEVDSLNNIKEDSSNFLSLIYSNNVLSSKAENLLKIQDQEFREFLLESDYNLPSFPTQDTITLTRNTNYRFGFQNNEIIDSIKLKGGTMVVNVASTYQYRGTLSIIVPKLTKNNKPLEILVDINKSDGTFTTTQDYDLNGYKLELEHPNVSDNRMSYNYIVKLINSGNGVSTDDNVYIDIHLNNINFSSMFGYIGQRQLLNTLKHFSVPLFRNVSNPNLQFRNPIIKVRSANSFGVPATLDLYNVKAVSEKDNKTVNLVFKPEANPFIINGPSIIGKTSFDTTIFDRSTVNIDQALEIGPNSIFYGIRSFSNPGGIAKNFVLDTSTIKVDIDIELPLDMKTTLLEFNDTIDMDLSDLGDNSEDIKSLLLHSSFENGMPIDLNTQVYLVDENYNHIDTLFDVKDQPIVKSGELDQEGKVIKATIKETDVVFANTQIEPLKNVKYAIIKAGIITANSGTTFVKLYSTYNLKVNFGIQTELEIKEE